jgi:hypothetical protein
MKKKPEILTSINIEPITYSLIIFYSDQWENIIKHLNKKSNKNISDYLKEKSDADLLDVETFSEYIKSGYPLAVDMTASLTRTDGLEAGSLTSESAELLRTDGIKIGDSKLAELIAGLSKTDGVKVGGSLLISMVSEILKTDGVKLDESILIETLAELIRTDGFKVGDSRLITALAELIKTDGLNLEGVRTITADVMELLRQDGLKLTDEQILILYVHAIYELSRTDGLKIGDSREILFVLAEAIARQYLRLVIHRSLRK